MTHTAYKLETVQNEGLVDRLLRFTIGAVMLGIGVGEMTVTPFITWWEALLVIASVYPLLTAILGWDPLYKLANAKTCSLKAGSHNQCGTLPYEMDAAMGHKPTPDSGFEYDHSMEATHHHTKEKQS